MDTDNVLQESNSIPDRGSKYLDGKKYKNFQIMKDMNSFIENLKLDNEKEFSEQVVQKEVQEFRTTRKQYEEVDSINFEDKIFRQTCTEEELKSMVQKSNQCFKCQKKFNMMNPRHQCKFCGNISCEQHARKHREDPVNKEFKRICDNCEDQYLKRIINIEFKTKKDKFDLMTKQLEDKQQGILEQRKIQQQEYDELKQKEQEEDNQFSQQQMKFELRMNRIQQEIKALNGDYKSSKEKMQILDDQIFEYFTKIEEKKNILKMKKEEEKDINNRIIATEYDIKEVQFIVDEIEKIITENNLRMEKQKVSKDNQATYFKQRDQRVENQNQNGKISPQRNNKKNTEGNEEFDKQACGIKNCYIF